MLKLICGPSGSGKSAELTRSIREDIENGVRCYLLVPEQQAYISERDLPKKLPKNAGLFFEIVNFSGLCEDVFREYGGVTQISADRGTRALLMWETLRSLSGALLQYGKIAKSDVGLTGSMLTAVEDLKNNGITADQLDQAAAGLAPDSPLRAKLLDLSAVTSAFELRMEQSFGGTASDRLMRLADVLRQHGYFEGAHFYIDSFTSFTVPEYTVLTEIIRQAGCVTVALCTNALNNASVQFAGVTETARKLAKRAAMADSPVQYTVLSSENNCRPLALRILERDLWRFDLREKYREIPPENGKDTVFIYACANLYEESETTALNILDLIRQGYRYGDLAVVVRETETYRGVLDAALERYGIPYFFSDRTDLSSKPLSRLVLSALRAVSRNYRTQDVITLVKTGLCGVDLREAALFEEYCETWHISGSRFTDPVWNMNPDGLVAERSARADEILEAANRVRATVMRPLQKLSANLRSSGKIPDRCRAIYDYLQEIGIAHRLCELATNEIELGQMREAGESLRIYRFLTDSLLKLCDLLPESEVSVDEFLSVLSILFSESDLGSVPNVHDCVMIGSAATLRVEGIQASFLLGLCEGEFPLAVNDGGILSDGDKEALRDFGIRFDTNRDLRSAEELLYVYRAITKPLSRLYLSYPTLNTDGKPKTESLAFTRVCYLLDRKPETVNLSQIRQNYAESTAKFDLLSRNTTPTESGASLYLSKTKINAFMRCPYSYYSNYTLHLRDRKDSATSSADDGKFIHFIFQKFLEKMLTPEGKLRFPDENELQTTVDEIVIDYLNRVCPIPISEMDTRMIHLFARLRSLAVILLRDTLLEISESLFVPQFFEEKIGSARIPDLSLPLKNGNTVHLTGEIDRVDLYRKDDQVYVRVVDYKTGSAKFSLDEVKSGMDMQLVFYLYAVTRIDPEHFIPAGAYYLTKSNSNGELSAARSGFILDDADILSEADQTDRKVLLAKLTKLSDSAISELIETVKSNVESVAERILSGEADKRPSEEACRYCPVRENCNVAAPLPKY